MIINLCAPNVRPFSFVKQTLLDLKGESLQYNNGGGFQHPTIANGQLIQTKKKINKEALEANYIIDKTFHKQLQSTHSFH
jgi:hypothetical protein